VDPGPEREEQLVSISTDGRVKAWTVAKGLEHTTLITHKRVPHRLVASAGGGRVNSAGVLSATAAAAGTVSAGSGAKAAATVAALRGDSAGSRGAVISRNTGGMSFDFCSTDRRMYLAGGGHCRGALHTITAELTSQRGAHACNAYSASWVLAGITR
jgi:hypothetical protein